MRTQVISDLGNKTIRLVHYARESGAAEETVLESFPFTIGRSETCDLRVDSGRVSREHAVITFDQGAFHLRDLGSTNGTFVNGRPVDDIVIADGDLLVIADVEYTFLTGAEGSRETATQVIAPKSSDGSEAPRSAPAAPHVAFDWVGRLRQKHETLTRRAVRSRFRAIIQLADDATIAHEAIPETSDGRDAAWSPLELDEECRLASSLRHLHRMVAVEAAAARAPDTMIIVHLDDKEIGCEKLFESLSALRAVAPDRGRCIVAIPDAAISDTPYVADLHAWLRRTGFGILHEGFHGPASQLAHRGSLAPDFVKLPPSMTRGIDLKEQRQEQLSGIIDTARAMGVQLIASEFVAPGEMETCQALGVALAQGALFGEPLESESPARRSSAPAPAAV